MSVYEFQKTIREDAVVSISNERYGFIWEGRAKFISSAFLPQFYKRKVVSKTVDKHGNVSITVQ